MKQEDSSDQNKFIQIVLDKEQKIEKQIESYTLIIFLIFTILLIAVLGYICWKKNQPTTPVVEFAPTPSPIPQMPRKITQKLIIRHSMKSALDTSDLPISFLNRPDNEADQPYVISRNSINSASFERSSYLGTSQSSRVDSVDQTHLTYATQPFMSILNKVDQSHGSLVD